MEDVLIQVHNSLVFVNFVVLDYATNDIHPLILGHSFFNMYYAIVDVHDGKLLLSIGLNKIDF